MKKEKEMKKICDILANLERTIRYKNSIGMFDINKYSEDFYCELINLTYGYKLVNVNFEEKNSKYIDLGDKDKGVCIQVTSRKDSQKIYNTLKKFNASDLVKDYSRFIFFLIAGEGEKISESKTKGIINFSIKEDIKCNETLNKDIFELSDDKREKVLNYLLNQTEENPIIFDYSTLEKPIYDIDKEYVERKVYLTSSYNSYFYSENNFEKLEDAIKLNKHIVLLSDAGCGKSELCKIVSNIINQKECAFYYRLNNYTNNKIEELKPKEYKNVPNAGITFILDSYDEIEDINKNTFIKKLNEFISSNPDVKIIVSSRTNFYKSDNFFDTFKTYSLTAIVDDDIRLILNDKSINYDSFLKEVSNKSLNHFLKNPFYLFKIIKKYELNKSLPNSKEFIKEMVIDTFTFDESKYSTTKDLEADEKKLYKLLGTIGLCMECLGRNTITKDELYEILPNKEDRKLLEYSGIWTKTKDEYLFIHNNFGEFLASEIMKTFSLEEIKKLITYENQENEIKSSWMNTLSFLLESYHNKELKKWIIDVFPDGIYYLEKHDFDEKTRNNIFISFFEAYENKKIWLPSNVLYGNAEFIDFISSKQIVEYLMHKIKENKHYTVVYNSLSILMSFQNFYGKGNEIKELFLELSINSKYTSQAKRYALKILADNGLIEEEELLSIIEKNSNKEDAYIRTGYFYVLERIGLTKKSVQIIFEKIDAVHKGLTSAKFVDDEDNDDNVNLLDEQIQYDELFLNLDNYDLLESVVIKIEELSKKGILHYFSKEIIKNICFSFLKLYKKDKTTFELIFRLYEVCSKNYDNDGLKIIPLELDKIGLRVELFKRFIELEEKRRFYADYHLINNECLEYFMKEYKNQKYSNDLAREVLNLSDVNYECYNNLNSLYYEKTGINLLEKRNKTIKDGCFKQDFFNVLFNVDEFIKCFNEFKLATGISNITIDSLREIDYSILEYNEKFQEMRHFFLHIKDKKIITEEYIKSLDWNWVILNECYKYLTRDKNLIVSKDQQKIICNICSKYLSKAKFENSIKYKKSGNGITTSYLIIFLWYFRNKFDFTYPEKILLDMLDFDWTMEDYIHVGIEYITKNVSAEKIKNRIISNINNKIMYDGVLKNQVNYCIENKISGLSDNLTRYLLDNNLSTYQKEIVVEYILFDKEAKVFTNNYLKKVNFETEILILQKIFDIDKKFLSEYLEKELKNEKDEKKIILYSKYLIKCNNLFGVQKYYDLLLKNKKDVDKSHNDSLKEALSKVSSCKLLDLVLKMYLLSFNKDFKDSRYDSLYNGCKNAIINIGLSNIKNSSIDETIKKLEELIDNNSAIENIGFTYYVIDELKQKYNQTNQTKKNINVIVKELNVIFANNKQSKGIVF